MPVLVNKNKSQIDLHFRITRPDIYKRCPLTDYFFMNYEIHTNTPNMNSLISHAIYHAFQHHEQSQGPLFIFDVLVIPSGNSFMSSGLFISNSKVRGSAMIQTDIPIQNHAIRQSPLLAFINSCANNGNKPIPNE